MPQKIKVAFLLSQFPTISETFILNQITGLLDLGQEVTIFSKFRGNYDQAHSEVKIYGLENRARYFGMPKNIFQRLIKAPAVFFRVFMFSPKIAFESLNISKYDDQAFSLTLLFAANYFIFQKEEGSSIDLIHAHFGPNGKLAVFLKEAGLLSKNIPIVTSFYGYDISAYVKNYGENTYKILFEKSDFIIAISQEMRERLVSLGCPSEKIIIHHLGIDPTNFKYQQKTKKSANLTVLTVARLVEKKGLEYSIRAFSKAVRKYKGKVEYFIIGDGELRKNIEELTEKLRVKDKVHLLGWKTQEEVLNFMEKADIFILTSITADNGDQEGTPTVLLEAMSSGLPVISTFHSGIPEQVKNGVSGILVPEKNVKKTAEALLTLFKSSQKRMEMGKMGRRIVEEEFDIKKLNKNLLKLYQNLYSSE